MSYVKTGTQPLRHLMTEIEKGQIKIPQFQRDYVWNVEKTAELIDSVIRGYPIGSLIYWRTADRLREVRNLGRLGFPEADRGDQVNYVLDGQQRLTSILAALYGLKVNIRDGTEKDFSSLIVHLNRTDDDSPVVRTDIPDEDGAICLPLAQIWSRQGKEFDACTDKIREVRDMLSDQLRTYDIPKVTLYDAEISVATEVFSRINTGGQELTIFEIMVAKTYDPNQAFDLVKKFDEFLEELKDVGFDSIDATDILQLIALMLKDDCKKKTILDLGRKEFINAWPEAIENLRTAVDYIKSSFRIPVSRLLPYSSLVVPIALFFNGTDRKPPSKRQAELLADFFWRAGWSERYSSAADSKLSQDKRTMKSIMEEKRVRYDWVAPVNAAYIKDSTFSASQAFSKTILALLASLQPQKYGSGDLVNLQNDWMRRANSMNFHHVFPKSYLKNKKNYEDWKTNLVLNISLVDDFLNKRVIRARAPSEYMQEFKNENENFEETMSTHLINVGNDEQTSSAVWDDDYERFIDERALAVVKLLQSKLVS